ncbi:MAG TPA: Gfo/Idh/MocA family oxidoreductase [Armatimonadota bacterium]|nr:Gfo/Idh/MocA family oxidoreductase [Armatimonadota bacterium]
MVRFGLIGLGEWARTVHIPNLLRLPEAQIAALASRSEGRLDAGRAAAGAHHPRLYTDYRELLKDPDLDAVIVCTPNATHEAITLEALEAGKHVLCEKPLSFTREGCERVAEAARRANRVFQVGLELRYADVSARLRELIEQGVVGTPRMARCLIWRDWGGPKGWRADQESSGGIYLELAVHYLDLLDWLVGGGPALIFSVGGRVLGPEITDHLWTTLSYEAGAQVNLGICVFAPAENLIPVEIVGDRGRIAADIITGRVELWHRGSSDFKLASPDRPVDYRFDGFPGSLESLAGFITSIKARTPPLAGIDAASRATILALAAQQSESSGHPARV